jgi:hypothetical protein
MDEFLEKAKGKVLSQKSITFLYNISVNQGPGDARKLVPEVLKAPDDQQYWRNFIEHRTGSWPEWRRDRLTTIQNSDNVRWDIVYDIE